jgi:hypothetical protein
MSGLLLAGCGWHWYTDRLQKNIWGGCICFTLELGGNGDGRMKEPIVVLCCDNFNHKLSRVTWEDLPVLAFLGFRLADWIGVAGDGLFLRAAVLSCACSQTVPDKLISIHVTVMTYQHSPRQQLWLVEGLVPKVMVSHYHSKHKTATNLIFLSLQQCVLAPMHHWTWVHQHWFSSFGVPF